MVAFGAPRYGMGFCEGIFVKPTILADEDTICAPR
jgi:hypothetical protein